MSLQHPAVAYLILVRPMQALTVCLIAFACALTTTVAAAADHLPKEVAQGRDLHLYDDGGVYRTPINEPEVTQIDSLRRFISSHWSAKRRGYVIVVNRNADSGARSYVFIEPSHGRWHISWRIVDYSALPEEWPTREMRDIVTVDRCRKALIFFDAKGRVVTTL